MFEDGDASSPSQERTRGTKQQLRKNDSARMRARRPQEKRTHNLSAPDAAHANLQLS
jgi:hypothetical protein